MRLGFTLIEIILVMAIIATLLGLGSVNLLSSQNKSSLATSVNTLISDLKSQQLKAMSGDTEGRGVADSYGIYFQSGSYTLFHGTTYSASDPANFTVSLNPDLTLTTTFTGSTIIFTKGSGQITGFVPGANTISLTTPAGTKTLHFNTYGVVSQVD